MPIWAALADLAQLMCYLSRVFDVCNNLKSKSFAMVARPDTHCSHEGALR
jgi:hypothetical protein